MRRKYRDRRTRGVAKLSLSLIYDGYEIKSLTVKKCGRRGGTRIMNKILNDADRESFTLYLVVVPSGPMDEKQLRAWYQRLGFENYGSIWMRRIPYTPRKPGNS